MTSLKNNIGAFTSKFTEFKKNFNETVYKFIAKKAEVTKQFSEFYEKYQSLEDKGKKFINTLKSIGDAPSIKHLLQSKIVNENLTILLEDVENNLKYFCTDKNVTKAKIAEIRKEYS